MLGQAFERFPAQVEAVEAGIWRFEPGHDADGVGVVVEAAGIGQRGVERIFAGMAERRVAEVVGEAECLGQVLVEAEGAGDGAADLRDLEAVGQADPEMVAVGGDEDLGLVAQAAEGDRVDDPVAVALENVARAARAESLSGWSRPRDRDGCAASAVGRVISWRVAQSCRIRNWSTEAFTPTDFQVLRENLARRTCRGTGRSPAATGPAPLAR